MCGSLLLPLFFHNLNNLTHKIPQTVQNESSGVMKKSELGKQKFVCQCFYSVIFSCWAPVPGSGAECVELVLAQPCLGGSWGRRWLTPGLCKSPVS